MGLDMYLYTNSKVLAKAMKDDGVYGYAKKSGCIAYWRKANQIHKWFVDNAQSGQDDCDMHEVTIDMLEELAKVCKEVIDNCKLVPGKVYVGDVFVGETGKWRKDYADGYVVDNPEKAAELLPTSEGFFFGATDYDTYYMEDVRYTYEKLTEVLSLIDGDHVKGEDDWNVMFFYRSSW